MSHIYITGDTHGDIDFNKLSSKRFPEGKKLTKDDYVIICGDVAVCWDGANQDRYLQKWYNEKPWTTLFVDGNHENFNLLNSYPVENWNGGKVHKISDSIIHLMRGQIYDIDGTTFFTFGGATSVDKMLRKEGVSWWPQEMATREEFEEGLNNLDKVNNSVDYIVTHCAPTYIHQYLTYDRNSRDDITNYLDIIRQTVDFKQHYFGHYHNDTAFLGVKYTTLYQKIIQIK